MMMPTELVMLNAHAATADQADIDWLMMGGKPHTGPRLATHTHQPPQRRMAVTVTVAVTITAAVTVTVAVTVTAAIAVTKGLG